MVGIFAQKLEKGLENSTSLGCGHLGPSGVAEYLYSWAKKISMSSFVCLFVCSIVELKQFFQEKIMLFFNQPKCNTSFQNVIELAVFIKISAYLIKYIVTLIQGLEYLFKLSQLVLLVQRFTWGRPGLPKQHSEANVCQEIEQ